MKTFNNLLFAALQFEGKRFKKIQPKNIKDYSSIIYIESNKSYYIIL